MADDDDTTSSRITGYRADPTSTKTAAIAKNANCDDAVADACSLSRSNENLRQRQLHTFSGSSLSTAEKFASANCRRLAWHQRLYAYGTHALAYEYVRHLQGRSSNAEEMDANNEHDDRPFIAGPPARLLTVTALLWLIEFLYIRFHLFSIPVAVRGVAYLIFALTLDALSYYVCQELTLGITIEACPVWVIGLIIAEKLLIETLLRRLHYCPIGKGHLKDDLQLFIEGLMTPPPPGCCGGTHRCAMHRDAPQNDGTSQRHWQLQQRFEHNVHYKRSTSRGSFATLQYKRQCCLRQQEKLVDAVYGPRIHNQGRHHQHQD